jgi:hypothetical protein
MTKYLVMSTTVLALLTGPALAQSTARRLICPPEYSYCYYVGELPHA